MKQGHEVKKNITQTQLKLTQLKVKFVLISFPDSYVKQTKGGGRFSIHRRG